MNIKILERKLFLKKQIKVYLITFLLSLSVNALHAQEIKGVVTGSGLPLAGASIIVKGTNKGVVTDFDGNYSINIAAGQTLVFSYIGFINEEILIKDQTIINVVMEEDLSTLDEVVIVGYGTQLKKEVTGAVGQVKAEELEKVTTSDIGTALQGQIAGVNVSSSSGAPGEEANILIRGFSSLIDGQNGPLYVVDGIPFDSDPGLSISEIESIDVLKDAASASIYGTRAAGGVILITTKKGKVGQMSIRVNSEYGFQDINPTFDLMTKEQYTYVQLTSTSINQVKTKGNVDGDIHRNPNNFTNNSTLDDLLLNDMAPIQNHSINISGGKEGLTYSFNGNYFGQEGIFYNSDFKRYNIRSNVEFKKDKWKVITGLNLRRDEKLVPLSGLTNRIYRLRPFTTQIDLDTNSLENAAAPIGNPNQDYFLNDARRIASQARSFKTTDERFINTHTGNIQIEFDPIKELKFTARFGATYSDQKQERQVPRFDVFDTDGNLISDPDNITSIRLTDITYSKITSEQFVNYKKQLGKHNFNLLLGTSFEKSENERYRVEKRSNINPAITVLDNFSDIGTVESGGQDYTRTLIGNIARIQYNFDGKYLLSASGRYDGSSQFSKDNRWGFFPSVSVGWNISDEPFWKPLKKTVNSVKMRMGYGTTGNDRFSAYSNQTVVQVGSDYVFGSDNASGDINNPASGNIVLGTTQVDYANADLKWETNVETNLGFDLGFFKNKLTFTTDVYKNEKEDLLYQVINPPSTGVSGNNGTTIFNVGNMQNTGVEYGLKYKHKGRESGFDWNVAATYTSNSNVVTKTSLNNPIIYLDGSYVSDAGTQELVSVITEGYEAAAFFLRETDGVIKTQEELEEYKTIDPGAQIGEFRYIDQLTVDTDGDGVADAGDGTIDDDDRVYSGSGTPDWEAGLNISANYKGFDFTMQWYGAFGAEIMNGGKAYAYQVGTHRDLFYAWTEQNPTSDIPWYDGGQSSSYRGASGYFLEDGDFIRLRNVSLGYNLPKKVLNNLGFSKCRFYIQGQNLLTITDYTGFDPEVGGNGLSTRGIDQGRYPLTSQYRLGVQLQF
ncbi:TonB-dependent receptor [Algibacter amylolyticus]|uniref:TonB-dependent receptor n=1 Tax=Algibacter amylolyticus TaxID=1608400 RepID=A0A5M7BBC3_9FLAO|nr:TonB-dependent receptor [Algibacter amylolyticus]KAA5824794.1 TonB-dependent receptor [Algibacter amylolyticus]MBB5268911.1 TonB-linked SusC/RagA family outer membrane protein [Algibacter amylolyticus]TSJ75959.1 TonB-dependent receptor [Algibacter amylolyticus]